MLNDDAHVAQIAALVFGNSNVALCPFARLLRAYRLLGVGAGILWHPGLGASYSGYLTVVLREIRRLGSGFSQVDSVSLKKKSAGCVHRVRTRLCNF